MALPNPNTNSNEKIGGLTNERLADLVIEQGSASNHLSSLVDITKMLLNSQEKLFEKIVNILDSRAEKTQMKDVAGSVAGKDSLGLAEAIKNSMGGFGLGTAITLAFLAWVTGLDTYLRLTLLPKFTALLGKTFSNIFKLGTFTDIIKNLKPFKDFMNGFKRVGIIRGAVPTPVQIKEFTTKFSKIGAFFGKIKNIVSPIITKILKFVAPVIKAFKNVFGFLKTLAPVAGIARFLRFAGGPFTMALFAVFDFISGFVKGFEEGGLLEGLKQGALELVRGFITKPLDLLKDIVAWAAGKLGFTEFQEQLNSFSFTELFNDAIKIAENLFFVVKHLVRNLFSAEPEEGYFSIVKWISGVFDTAMTNAKNNLADVGDVFSGIWKFATNLFSADPEEGYFSLVSWVGDKLNSVRESLTKLFSSSDTDGVGGGFDLSSILPSLDFEIPSVAKITEEVLATVGEKINNAFQWIASEIPNYFGLPDFFSDAGISLAESLGAQSLKKYNSDTGVMDVISIPQTITETGAAVGASTQRVSQMQEARGTGGAVVVAPNNSSANIQTTNVSSANYNAPAPTVRPRIGMGAYAQ